MDKGYNQDEMKYYVKCEQGVKVFYTLQDAWKYYAKMKDFLGDSTAEIWDDNGLKMT